MRFALCLLLVACGTESAIPEPAPEPDASSRPSYPPDAPFFQPPDPEPTDAGPDAPAADACVPPPLASTPETSRSCRIEGPCPTCAEGRLVRCEPYGGTAQPGAWSPSKPFAPPPTPGCRLLAAGGAGGDSLFCCPLGCVRQVSSDAKYCNESATGLKAVACPSNADGTPSIPPPSGCSYPAPLTSTQLVMCCS